MALRCIAPSWKFVPSAVVVTDREGRVSSWSTRQLRPCTATPPWNFSELEWTTYCCRNACASAVGCGGSATTTCPRIGRCCSAGSRPWGYVATGDKFAEMNVTTVHLAGEPMLLAYIEDVTARRQLEQDAAAASDDLIATVSHELRTPLTSIVGYTELLADVIASRVTEGDLNEELTRMLQVVERNAARERDLVEDLLTMAFFDGKETRIALASVDLNKIVRQVVEDPVPRARSAGVKLSVAENEAVAPRSATTSSLRGVRQPRHRRGGVHRSRTTRSTSACTTPGHLPRSRSLTPGAASTQGACRDCSTGSTAHERHRFAQAGRRSGTADCQAHRGRARRPHLGAQHPWARNSRTGRPAIRRTRGHSRHLRLTPGWLLERA